LLKKILSLAIQVKTFSYGLANTARIGCGKFEKSINFILVRIEPCLTRLRVMHSESQEIKRYSRD